MNEVDKSNMGLLLDRVPDMIKDAMNLGNEIEIIGNVNNVVISGMGGSAFPGDLLKSFMGDSETQVFVNKKYTLPRIVNESTLLFSISYSGNTEEAIDSYKEGLKRHAKIVTISCGGKLEELAKENNTFHIKVPSGLPPRMSTPYLFVPLLKIISKLNMIENQDSNLKKVAEKLKNKKIRERAKEISNELKDKTPLIYSSEEIFCVAEKWKIDINENSKTSAFYNVFPESNHNEINSYVNLIGNYHVVLIRDSEDHPRNKKRFDIFKKVVESKNVGVTDIKLEGDNLLERLLWGLNLGAWVSYYLALE
ncbi:MAG: bifunctional phosphoglucose/phosphomannose isomerase, partial [Actinomycetota bacterium]